jgi:hypothetical protein
VEEILTAVTPEGPSRDRIPVTGRDASAVNVISPRTKFTFDSKNSRPPAIPNRGIVVLRK